MVAAAHLSDAERFPLLTEAGRRLLDHLREHPRGPRFNMRCGDRLTQSLRESVLRYQTNLFGAPPAWRPGEAPPWVHELVERCLARVPIYRRRGGTADDLTSIPPVGRDDLAREPWSFVPDDALLDDLIVYYTSGTHGRPIDVLSHPVAASARIPLYRAALAAHGVELQGGEGRVAIAFVCSQKTTLTWASISSFLGGAGIVKVNLNPSEWRDPADRAAFLDDCAPELLTGDPLSFADLAALPLRMRPKALISSAMHLLPATRAMLEERFRCPVIDVYSTCESGPIAFAKRDGFRVLPNDLYVEVLDKEGHPCAAGERGEIALTGGRNLFFPMLRYRTGDWAALGYEDGTPVLRDLEGRAPLVFAGADGRDVNNIDVTAALRPFAFAQFALHQNADGSLRFRYRGGDVRNEAIASALRELFGDRAIETGPIPPDVWKTIPYSRDAPAA